MWLCLGLCRSASVPMPKFTTPDRPKCVWVTGARSQDRAPFDLRHPIPTLRKLISFVYPLNNLWSVTRLLVPDSA